MLRHVAILLLGFASTVQAATVVVNDNVVMFHRPGETKYGFDVIKFPEVPHPGCGFSGCNTQAILRYENETIKAAGGTVDEASDWFFVEPGDIFSVNTIDVRQFPIIINLVGPARSSGPVVVGPGEFYLGVRTGNGFGLAGPNRSIYGWVHMRPENGVLTMVENVLAYNTTGIIIGTTTVVPEPSTSLLGMLGCCLPLCTRRR